MRRLNISTVKFKRLLQNSLLLSNFVDSGSNNAAYTLARLMHPKCPLCPCHIRLPLGRPDKRPVVCMQDGILQAVALGMRVYRPFASESL